MKHSEKLKKLIICALMIAVASVLSFVKIDMPMGGGVTVCSMTPIVLAAFIYGPVWGLSTAFIYSVFQLLFGLDNLAYATSIPMAILILLFDYIVAYSVIGLAGFFRDKENSPKKIVLATVCVLMLRFVCHFITGWFVWDALWPNEFGLSPALYSFCYNGIYMLPEIVVTSVSASLLCSSKQIKGLLTKEAVASEESRSSEGKLIIGIGITFIAIQVAAYVGLYFTDALVFFADTSSVKAILLEIWHLFSHNLVGIAGIIFTVWGFVTAKKSKR